MTSPCLSCELVKTLRDNKAWIHALTRKIQCEKFQLSMPFDPNHHIIDDVFQEPSHEHGTEAKPNNTIWFSRGTWLFDPYHDNPLHENHTVNNSPVLLISNPQNILLIQTADEMMNFVEKYHINKPSELSTKRQSSIASMKTNVAKRPPNEMIKAISERIKDDTIISFFDDLMMTARKQLMSTGDVDNSWIVRLKESFPQLAPIWVEPIINSLVLESLCEKEKELEWIPDYSGMNWNKVRDDGYYGVAFDFRRVSEIGLNDFDTKYKWYLAYDVESLAVWDLRAFNNSGIPLMICQ